MTRRGVSGLLARQNARRTPRRTATTASALMIGTALMAASFILSSSITESVERGSDEQRRDRPRRHHRQSARVQQGSVRRGRALPEVTDVAEFRVARFKVGNATKDLVGLPSESVDPDSSRLAIDIDVESGTIWHWPTPGSRCRPTSHAITIGWSAIPSVSPSRPAMRPSDWPPRTRGTRSSVTTSSIFRPLIVVTASRVISCSWCRYPTARDRDPFKPRSSRSWTTGIPA